MTPDQSEHHTSRPGCRAVVGWVGWHVPELLGTAVPLVGVWLISAWCVVVSVAVATWWAVHEVGTRCAQPTVRAATVGAVSSPSVDVVDGVEQAGGERRASA